MVPTAALVSWIFDFMAANYGHAWARSLEHSSYKARVNVWSEAIKGIEKDQLVYAKKKILSGDCYLDFPPSAAQFRQLCKAAPENLDGQIIRFDPNHDKIWFGSLSDSQKLKVYQGAIMAYPLLEQLIKNSNQSFLDDSFQKSIWIKPMIEAFREFYKIDTLVGFKIENLGTKEYLKS